MAGNTLQYARPEHCEYCHTVIPNDHQANLFDGHVACDGCYAQLRKPELPSAASRAAPTRTFVAMAWPDAIAMGFWAGVGFLLLQFIVAVILALFYLASIYRVH